jgi:hypothetical protein
VSLLPHAVAGTVLLPLLHPTRSFGKYATTRALGHDEDCWLDVCAPLVVQNAELGLYSEVVLTSDTFIGQSGYTDGADTTEYEVYLYDSSGNAIGADGVAKRLVVPAMHTTTISLKEVLSDRKEFWGGMRIRLRPKGRAPMHASDLFSSAFVRWKTDTSFDNVHANPDPIEWQRPDPFFYSMPFPPLNEYDALFSLFNPNGQESAGQITVYDAVGQKMAETAYELRPHASLLFDLRRGEFTHDPRPGFGWSDAKQRLPHTMNSTGGSVVVTNRRGSQKSFAYLMLNRRGGVRFTVEHPIHQPPFNPVSAPPPFDAAGRLKAKNILFTPMVFRAKRIGGITLDSRFHFSSGAPMEESLWLSPFVTDGAGTVAWQPAADKPFPSSIAPKQIERGAIKLPGMQSCVFNCAELPLPKTFSGGMSLPVAPSTNHTLMKVEISVKEWNAHAFTHFRPGLQSARSYQASKPRGVLATDYIASNARLEKLGHKILRDEVIGVMNIDDKIITGRPMLEVHSAQGLLARIELGEVPSFACRHYLLSEIASERIPALDLTLRLVDERATLLMSVAHLDYVRRDLALDHGSDRFSTFNDFTCHATS